MSYKALIFDLDGTLLNTIDDLGDSANHILCKLGFPTHTIDEYKYFVGNGIPKLIERCKRAVQLTKSDYDRYDHIIAMDEMNIRNIMRIIKSDPENKVSLLLSHAGMSGSIADPWYTGNFDDTYRDVLLGCKGLFREVTGE